MSENAIRIIGCVPLHTVVFEDFLHLLTAIDAVRLTDGTVIEAQD